MSSADQYSEPSSGTDLDNEDIRAQDDQELIDDDDIEIDESAEREAQQFPLQPAERRAANAFMDMRDMQDENVNMPAQLRQQMQRRYETENVAQQLQQMQFDSSEQQAPQLPTQMSDTYNTSLMSETLRRYSTAAYQLKSQKPLNDDAFRSTCADLEKQPANQQLREYVVVKYLHFLKTFQQNVQITEYQPPKYILRAQDLLGHQEKSSLTIDLSDLNQYSHDAASFLVNNPRIGIDLLNIAINKLLSEIERNFSNIHRMIEARIRVDAKADNLPLNITALKQLQTSDLNKLVAVRGVVTSRSEKKPRLLQASFICKQCKCIQGPFDVRSTRVLKQTAGQQQDILATIIPKKCSNENCSSLSLSMFPPGCLYQDIQKLTVQERQEDTQPGFMPEKKDVLITGDLINQINPGDTVLITGNYQMIGESSENQAFPYYQTIIEANHVSTEQDVTINLTAQDCIDLELFAKHFTGEDLDSAIFDSIAPSIHGHKLIKQAVAMSLISGVSHEISKDQPKTRGDLHVLILGDPGIAKSQILRYVEKCAPKSILTAGKGASAAGLTVAVKRSHAGDYTLQAGALVLANGGVCLIDELDKMAEQDRVALHQAMEQQEVSIAKAGIIATLPARAAVIAAANPVNQQYNQNIPLNYNINIGEALISRFDLICIAKDQIDEINDSRLAKFIVDSHTKNHENNKQMLFELDNEKETLQNITALIEQAHDQEKPDEEQRLIGERQHCEQRIQRLTEQVGQFIFASDIEQIPEKYNVSQVVGWIQNNNKKFVLPQSFLKKYISYAKQFEPSLSNEVIQQIKRFYSTLRSKVQDINGVQVTQRAIGTLIRLTEAHAKMHLQKECTTQNVQYALDLYSQLFVSQQKGNQQRRIERELRHFKQAGAEDFVGVLAVLDDCFRKLLIMRQNGAAVQDWISIQYLRNECQVAGIEVVESYFDRPDFTQAYDVRRGNGGVAEQIMRK
ncbi:DNA_replication licensing factor MCM2 [Hexamita inflata]|uniref:DNA helicase n=1 Tax=Hexamita inflata TaxID=28002 RepID=A0AA86PM34_9EUKA|nr:DNA replication licensing factor MCM2 [Hexamita inflata]